MPLAAPTHPGPRPAAPIAKPTNGNDPARPEAREGVVIRFPSTSPTRQLTLSVEFSSPDGRIWHAIGGGDTITAAIAYAHDSCPTGTTWQPLHWNDLYGD